MKNDERVFIEKLYFLIFILIGFCIIGTFLVINNSYIILKVGIIMVLAALTICVILILWVIYNLFQIINNKKISKINYRVLKNAVEVIYPLTLFITKIFKSDVDSIRRFYANINNFLVKAKTNKIKSEELLILLPHCLQNSECKIKITNDIQNCSRCGKCNISQIIELSDRYNVKTVVATGGTLAREWIRKLKPKGIIAVACERDLSSGINEIKSIPIIGVLNDRPNGPCYNTKVDLKELESAIKFFIREE